MGVEYRIDPSEGIMYEVYKGPVAVEELMAVINKEHADPLFKYGMPTIADLTEVSADWDYLQINQFRNFIKAIYLDSREKIKWAIIAPPAPERGIIKVLDIMNEVAGTNVEMCIFEEREEALKWIRAR